MRKVLVAIVLCCFFAIPLTAQDYPRAEVYGGYQLLLDDDFLDQDWNFDQGTYLHGFAAAAEINVKSFFSIVGEVGYGKTSFSDYFGSYDRQQTTLLVGPRFGHRGGRARIFGHVLIGFNHEKGGYESSTYSQNIKMTNFATALGGGLDISAGSRISIRPFQLDVVSTRYGDTYGAGYQHQLRYTGGISVKLGAIPR